MRFLSIELNGYRRFSLNNIDHFAMSFESTLQLILGTNGSGKSSLMEQLSVLPPDASDFNKTGSKVLKVDHNHSIYTLGAFFSESKVYSFKLGDEELNDGGKITMQRDLVRKHFGMTSEIQGLLLDKEPFTDMSPSRRKEWMLRLCDTNYDYAMSVYSRLKDSHRDVAGAIKIAKNTLVQESEKLILDDEVIALNKEIDALHQCLNELLEIRKPIESDVDNNWYQQEMLDKQLLTATHQLETIHERTQYIQRSVSDYDGLIATAHEQLVRSSAVFERLGSEFKKVQSKIAILQRADMASMSDLKKQVLTLEHDMLTLQDKLLVKQSIPQANAGLTRFLALKDSLSVIFSEIPINTAKRYSQQQLIDATDKLRSDQVARGNLSEKLYDVANRIKHQEAHRDKPDQTCPKCDHRFSADFSLSTYQAALLSKQEYEEGLAKLDKVLAENEEYISRCQLYATYYRQFHNLSTSNSTLWPYWRWLQDQGYLTESPRSGLNALLLIEADLLAQSEIEAMGRLKEEKLDVLKSLESLGSADMQSLQQQHDDLNVQLGNISVEMQTAQRDKNLYQSEQAMLKQREELLLRVKKIIGDKQTIAKDTQETIKRSALIALIRYLQSELATREQRVASASVQKQIVTNLSNQIATLTQEEKDYQILLKRLSPTEGLIAEGLLGFIKNFVDQMNSLIKRVWTYRLVLLTCDLVEGEAIDLDYKFPIEVESREAPIHDISKGSSGMMEIINLAYKLTAVQYLGMQDHPLYLDEFGKPFDVTHKSTAINIIKTLVEQKTFPQVFLISHDFHQYGGLSNCDITLLNSLNVASPAGVTVNKHVVMQ